MLNLWCNNLSIIALQANHVLHGCTKHMELDIHFIRERIPVKFFVVQHIPSYEQLVDALTKLIAIQEFLKLHNKLSVIQLPQSLWAKVINVDDNSMTWE